MALFLAHTFLLLGASWLGSGRLLSRISERLVAMLLLSWANLVATSLLLSCFGRLGESAWFFRTSLALALVTIWAFRRVAPEPAAPAPVPADKFHRGLLVACCATLLPIAWIGLRLAATYEPNNYDSLTYHLPRAMFYMGQGDLSHFSTGNPRQTYFPFNYNLLQLAALIYSPPVQVVNFINFAASIGAGLALYRLCRLSALGANAALAATWLTLTSTQVLAQATATTNDLLTGTGLLTALLFALRWHQHRLRRDALLAGLAAGLTAGAKLTIVFFIPAGGLLILLFAWQHLRRGEFKIFLRGVRAWVLPAALAAIFAAPFAIINLAEQGEWINKTYDFTRNLPFSFASAWQTAQAYLVQMFLEPLHRFTFNLQFTAELNAWGEKTFFPHWNPAYAFSPLYLFPPDLNEDHVWFGFTGPVILLAALFCLFRCRRQRAPLAWLAWVGLGWFATYFLLNKWSLYNQRYFVPAILVLGPCLAAALEAGWHSPRLHRATRNLAVLLAVCSVWLAGIYFFCNTSRPYAPLWAGEPPPPALPSLPALMQKRMAEHSRVNIHSTDGNERIFLFMTHAKHQRFTAFAQPVTDAYNVFSEWGFVRKVAYTNIEQLSSYTIVRVPAKPTAGVEFLGTLGSGQPALDYYGLLPNAGQTPSSADNRNVLVEFYYRAREPDRYQHMRIRAIGLNPGDQARLQVGVDYDDGTSEQLATFTNTGEAQVSVVRPFRRFTVRVTSQNDGQELGAIGVPHLLRDRPGEDEAPVDPAVAFSDELVVHDPLTLITTTGLNPAEGPYPQWDMPLVRWVKSPVLRLDIPTQEPLDQLEVSFDLRLQARDSADIDVVFNGELIHSYHITSRNTWLTQKLKLIPRPGTNVLEFRNVTVGTQPDWTDYLARYPDVKAFVLAQRVPLEQGAREHWEIHGQHETRTLNLQRHVESATSGEASYYFLFRHLVVEGYRKP